jgi:hypothetical protein
VRRFRSGGIKENNGPEAREIRAHRARAEEDERERNVTIEPETEIQARYFRIMRTELALSLGLPEGATVSSILELAKQRIEAGSPDRKYSIIPPDDALNGRLEDIETQYRRLYDDHQRLVRSLRQRGVI